MKVIISFATYQVEAELYDTPTGRSIYEGLPIQRNVNRWGDEIYFEIPVHSTLEEEAKAEVSVGELAYWPNMPAFCIFFGPTPVSTGETPVAASPVNVFGRLLKINLEELRRIPDGENVVVERAG
ncbi:MAG: cyclophilin-like fold protein [Bacteroidota bacterium]